MKVFNSLPLLIVVLVNLSLVSCGNSQYIKIQQLDKEDDDLISYWIYKDTQTDKYGVKDEDGNLIVPFYYDSITAEFCHVRESLNDPYRTIAGIIYVYAKDWDDKIKKGAYNLQGERIVPIEYDQVMLQNSYYSNSEYMWIEVMKEKEVRNKTKYFYSAYKLDGKQIVPLREQYIHTESQVINGETIFFFKIHDDESRTYSLLDKDGTLVLGPTNCDLKVRYVQESAANRCYVEEISGAPIIDAYLCAEAHTEIYDPENGIDIDEYKDAVYNLKGECIIPFSRNFNSIVGFYMGGRCYFVGRYDDTRKAVLFDAHGKQLYRSSFSGGEFKYDAVKGFVERDFLSLWGENDKILNIMLDETNTTFN